MHIATFNVRTLNRIDRFPELTASVLEHNIDIVCVQEYRYHRGEEEIKYHDTGNGWTFIAASAWRNPINTAVEGVGMLLSSCTLKSLNSIEKIQPSYI